MGKIDIILVANSPGELSSLVKPVAAELARHPAYRVILVLTPCQYNSGKELDYVKTLPGIDLVVSASEFKSWALLNKKPPIEFAPKGLVLYLGGDLAYPIIIAKKLHYPPYAYINERLAWKKAYKKFFVPDEATKQLFNRGLSPDKLINVGNLMVDSVQANATWRPEKNVITFMPGSRSWEIDYMTPFYEQVIKNIKAQTSNIKIQLVSSPFIKATPIAGAKLVSFEEINNSELVVTIPGTNTALIAARGIPQLVVFPLNNPEVIPMDGLGNYVGRLPILGKLFKQWVANMINKKTKYFALPNMKASRLIAPEIRGIISPAQVAGKVIELLNDEAGRGKMSLELTAAMGQPGAAKKIAEEINAAIS
ncbi:hypothetical protein A2311_02185 [candidate division WOR-1 bacterium RIFOXYB2_FULL_48_7]|uniref:Uncharacterized protein n=1 Tax=candidate division WOR-1 bacterium RIFOXYB2_FULL_48_7 TaxID=1802583 RepID=A0A1F4TKU7_UNCSA|nr:MAG: hypothetical protein A2311_02185 [candidate division WOR-1 bacterium RIFOXYB2_FULL_48_7]